MIVVVDCSFICHMSKYSLKGLSYDLKETGVIFGFLKQLLTNAIRFDTNKFVFIWDSKKSVRKIYCPEYKEKRAKDRTDEEKGLNVVAYPQFNELREQILPEIGFQNIFMQTGLEADDLIAMFCHFMKSKDEIVVIASDHDLYQVLDSHVSLFNPIQKVTTTFDSFFQQYGIHPKMWGEVLAIAGCDTDNVKGISGVGKITAVRYLLNHLSVSTKAYQKIISKEGQERIQFNKPLVCLPHGFTKPVEYSFNEELSLQRFVDVCMRYGFSSFTTNDELIKWRKALSLK